MDYAFLIMGPYDPARDDARFPGSGGTTRMIGVPDISTAEKIAAKLKVKATGQSSCAMLSEKTEQSASSRPQATP